jgi:hypothetical protein
VDGFGLKINDKISIVRYFHVFKESVKSVPEPAVHVEDHKVGCREQQGDPSYKENSSTMLHALKCFSAKCKMEV